MLNRFGTCRDSVWEYCAVLSFVFMYPIIEYRTLYVIIRHQFLFGSVETLTLLALFTVRNTTGYRQIPIEDGHETNKAVKTQE